MKDTRSHKLRLLYVTWVFLYPYTDFFFHNLLLRFLEYKIDFCTCKFRRGGEWEQPDDSKELSGFTFESAIKWITYAKEHMRIRCEDDEANKEFFVIL